VSGEANIWPFYTGVVADRTTMAAALAYYEQNKSFIEARLLLNSA